jgi:hypothetical protein
MTSTGTTPDNVPKPFQFRLRSLFLLTAAICVVISLLRLEIATFVLLTPILHVVAGGLLIVLTRGKAAGGFVVGLAVGPMLFVFVGALGFLGTATSGAVPTMLFLFTVTLAGFLGAAIAAIRQGHPVLGLLFLLVYGGLWFASLVVDLVFSLLGR